MTITTAKVLRVALYTRVSTDEQADSGFSLRGQERDLREQAGREGWRVVDVIVDDGYSGGDPFRPGWARVMELARSGQIDAVAATKMDRFFRDEFYFYAAQHQLKEYGVDMLALDRTGNRIGDGAMISYAAWERERIAERLHGGIRNMIGEGGVKAGPKPPYGYRLDATGRALTVFEPEAEAVRTIYRMAANGESQGRIRDHLDDSGIPSPGRSNNGWNRTTIRNILRNDLYRPHTHDEVAALVSEEVAARLDGSAVYGLWCWNRRKTIKRKEWSEDRGGFVTRYSYEENDADSLLWVPVEDMGIPLEVVEDARANASKNGRRWLPNGNGSGVGSHFFELRGMVRCPDCGSVLSPHSVGQRGESPHLYYVCRSRYNNSRRDCQYRTHHRAEDLERAVLGAMRRFLDKRDHYLRTFDAYAEEERVKLRRSFGDDTARATHEELRRLERRRDGYLEQEADGIIGREELTEKLSDLDANIERLREYLDAARSREQDTKTLEAHLKRQREEIVKASERWINRRATGKDRAEMYRNLRLQATPKEDRGLELTGTFGRTLVSSLESIGWRT